MRNLITFVSAKRKKLIRIAEPDETKTNKVLSKNFQDYETIMYRVDVGSDMRHVCSSAGSKEE